MISLKRAIWKIEIRFLDRYVGCVRESEEEFVLDLRYKDDDEWSDDDAWSVSKKPEKFAGLVEQKAFYLTGLLFGKEKHTKKKAIMWPDKRERRKSGSIRIIKIRWFFRAAHGGRTRIPTLGRSYSAAELAPHDRYTITTRAKIKNFFAQLTRAINTRVGSEVWHPKIPQSPRVLCAQRRAYILWPQYGYVPGI